MRAGIIYTETVIYSAPEAFAKDVPYQTAIVSLEGGGRLSGRILGDRVAIGDRVAEDVMGGVAAEGSQPPGVTFFRKV